MSVTGCTMPSTRENKLQDQFETNRSIQKPASTTKRKKRHSIDSGSIQKVKAAAVSQADNNPTVKLITKEMAERRRLEKVALEVRKPRLVLSSLLVFWDTRNINSVYTQLLPLQIVVSC